ncbi:MAG TPA: hypothetical protein VGM74_06940 [Burkholderiaceae bacterium]|jgi:4-hydroxy-L-threonine phosphate dehydrogenase PdxA
MTREFDAVVAGPHHETAIHEAGIAFSGHPSLLASTGRGSAMDIAGRGSARPDAQLRSLRLVSGLADSAPARPDH